MAADPIARVHAGLAQSLRGTRDLAVQLAPAQAALHLVLAPEDERVASSPSTSRFSAKLSRAGKEAGTRHLVAVDEIGRRALVADHAGRSPTAPTRTLQETPSSIGAGRQRQTTWTLAMPSRLRRRPELFSCWAISRVSTANPSWLVPRRFDWLFFSYHAIKTPGGAASSCLREVKAIWSNLHPPRAVCKSKCGLQAMTAARRSPYRPQCGWQGQRNRKEPRLKSMA